MEIRGLDSYICDGPAGVVIVDVECDECGHAWEDEAQQDCGTVNVADCPVCGGGELTVCR